MNNVEKITEKILGDAKAYETDLLAQTEKEIDGIKKRYMIRAEEAENLILEKGAKSASAVLKRAESDAALIKKNAVLQMKASLVDEVFKHAEEKIVSMPENEFSDFLLRILKSAAENGKGEIIFNVRDRNKFGKKFVSDANDYVKKSKPDCEFVLSGDTANIKNGFILKYGDVEVNCSIEKIIGAKRAQLESKVVKILFADKNK